MLVKHIFHEVLMRQTICNQTEITQVVCFLRALRKAPIRASDAILIQGRCSMQLQHSRRFTHACLSCNGGHNTHLQCTAQTAQPALLLFCEAWQEARSQQGSPTQRWVAAALTLQQPQSTRPGSGLRLLLTECYAGWSSWSRPGLLRVAPGLVWLLTAPLPGSERRRSPRLQKTHSMACVRCISDMQVSLVQMIRRTDKLLCRSMLTERQKLHG